MSDGGLNSMRKAMNNQYGMWCVKTTDMRRKMFRCAKHSDATNKLFELEHSFVDERNAL